MASRLVLRQSYNLLNRFFEKFRDKKLPGSVGERSDEILLVGGVSEIELEVGPVCSEFEAFEHIGEQGISIGSRLFESHAVDLALVQVVLDAVF